MSIRGGDSPLNVAPTEGVILEIAIHDSTVLDMFVELQGVG